MILTIIVPIDKMKTLKTIIILNRYLGVDMYH